MHDRIKITITRNANYALFQMFVESAKRLEKDKSFRHPAVRSEG